MNCRISGLMKWLQESFLVEAGLGFDQQFIDLLQSWRIRVGKRILNWFFDNVVCIADVALVMRIAANVGDRVASGASDPGLRRWIFHIVVVWFVKCPAKERHRIVTTSAPSARLGRFHLAPARLSASPESRPGMQDCLNELK